MKRFVTNLLGLVFGITATSAVWADESSFNIYGFADANASRNFIEKNNFLSFFVQDNFTYGLSHFNIYNDWKPNANTRVLLEVAFADKTTIGGGFPTRTLVTHTTDIDKLPAPVQAGLAAAGLQATRVDTVLVESPKNTFGTPQVVRGYFEVMVNQYINFRAGKFITPAGIWNVDHGSPVILPIKQPYETTLIPIFPEFQDGVTLFGNGFLGDHDYDYAVYVSTGSNPDENKLEDMSFLSGGGHATLKLDLPVKTKIGLSGYSGLTRYSSLSAVAERNVSILPFMTATGFDQAGYTSALMVPPGDDMNVYSETPSAQQRELALGVDLRLDMHGAFLQSEYNTRTSKNELNRDKETVYTGYYGIIGYKAPIKEWLSVTPYFMYESLLWEDIGNSYADGTLAFMPMEGFDSYIGGVNLGLFGNVYIKLEYSLAVIKKLDAPPALPFAKNKYSDSDLNITSFSSQFAIAF